MKILNLGCGTSTIDESNGVNVDWSPYLRIRRNPILRVAARWVLGGERLRKLRSLPANVVVYDLARGIPFPDGSADAVYHSHFLEHLDRDKAARFLQQVRRVLRIGGVHRVVVPDLEALCSRYLDHIGASDDPVEAQRHDDHVADLIEQMVRREAFGTSRQRGLRRFVENLLLGDARRRGETHQWMYDRINLAVALRNAGFRDIRVQGFDTSLIPGWDDIGLDRDDDGNERKPDSLYMEARA